MSSNSGEAAEQVVRMSLDGAEVAIRLAGNGAKHLAILLYNILSKTKLSSISACMCICWDMTLSILR